jgi:hypothetical protein
MGAFFIARMRVCPRHSVFYERCSGFFSPSLSPIRQVLVVIQAGGGTRLFSGEIGKAVIITKATNEIAGVLCSISLRANRYFTLLCRITVRAFLYT